MHIIKEEKCLNCKKEPKRKDPASQFCSEECKLKYFHGNYIEKKCAFCDRKFRIKNKKRYGGARTKGRRTNGVTCSKKCSRKYAQLRREIYQEMRRKKRKSKNTKNQ